MTRGCLWSSLCRLLEMSTDHWDIGTCRTEIVLFCLGCVWLVLGRRGGCLGECGRKGVPRKPVLESPQRSWCAIWIWPFPKFMMHFDLKLSLKVFLDRVVQLAIYAGFISVLYCNMTVHRGVDVRDGVVLMVAREERTNPELVHRGGRVRLAVLAGDVGGRWQQEIRAFWHQLAKAKTCGEAPSMLSCAAARASERCLGPSMEASFFLVRRCLISRLRGGAIPVTLRAVFARRSFISFRIFETRV